MAREDVRHGDEPVGITIRKRAQENAVDDAKDGSGCADSDGQREHDDESEAGTLAQSTGGVTKILGDRFDRIRHAGVSRSRLDDRRTR
jgi:hypothetical protein